MIIQQRFKAPIPSFFKKLRNTAVALFKITRAIFGASVALPAILTKITFYAAEARTMASTLSKATLAAAVQQPKKKKETGKPLSEFLPHFGKPSWHRGAYIAVNQQVAEIVCCPPSSDSFIGKLWRIPILAMAHRTVSAETEKLTNLRRYQFSVGEIFLIP